MSTPPNMPPHLLPMVDGKPVPLHVPAPAVAPPSVTTAPRILTPSTPAPGRAIVRAPEDMFSPFVDLATEARRAVEGAHHVIDRPLDAFLWWPWESMHLLTNSIPPGELWIIAGMSGAGKTTLLMSLADHWARSGVKVAYCGLEMRAKELLVHLVCRRLASQGIVVHPGDVFKGKLEARHPERLDDAETLRMMLRAEADAYIKGGGFEMLRFVPLKWLTAADATKIAKQAAALGVQAIIVDHLDQVDGDDASRSEIEQHNQVLKAFHNASREYGITLIGGAQMNTEALRRPGALLRSHQRPTTDMVQFGMYKRRICDILCILHKPLPSMPDIPDEAEHYAAAMRRLREDPTLIERYLVPNTMGITLDKDRPYGRDGARARLGVYASRITDADPTAEDFALGRLLSLARPDGSTGIAQRPVRKVGGDLLHMPAHPRPEQVGFLDD